MKLFRYLFASAMMVVCVTGVKAQVYSEIAVGSGGSLIRAKTANGDVVGSPFLLKDWVGGKVMFEGAEPNVSEKINFDVMEGVLVMKKGNQEYLFKEPVTEFILNAPDGERLFRKIGGSFYEVLYDGRTKLVQKHVKTIMESTAYGSATVTKKIESETAFYLVVSGQLTEKIKNENGLVTALSNKSTELKAYIKANKFSFKRNDDVINLLKYYDSL